MCAAHLAIGDKAAYDMPQMCPVCLKRIKKGTPIEMTDSGIPAHAKCRQGQA